MSCSVISLNVCSIVASSRRSLLIDFIQKNNANIYLLQETQTDCDIKFNIPGYNVFRLDIKRGWSGLAIIIDNSIPVGNLKLNRQGVHSISIECKFSGDWQRISSAYFPIGKLDYQLIYKFFTNNPNTFIGSDTNAWHTSFGDLSDNVYGRYLSDIARTTSLKIFNPINPSCLRAVGGSFIDKFISNSNLQPVGNVTTIPNFSDHLAIQCNIPVTPPNTEIYIHQSRDFSKTKLDKLNKFILRGLMGENLPLRQNLLPEDCEQLASNINGLFTSAIKKFVPLVGPNNNQTLLSSCTRILQNESKKSHRQLFKNRDFFRFNERAFIKARIRLLKQMILNNVRHETGQFFTNIYNNIENHRDAFRVIKRYTGHKKNSLYGWWCHRQTVSFQFCYVLEYHKYIY